MFYSSIQSIFRHNTSRPSAEPFTKHVSIQVQGKYSANTEKYGENSRHAFSFWQLRISFFLQFAILCCITTIFCRLSNILLLSSQFRICW